MPNITPIKNISRLCTERQALHRRYIRLNAKNGTTLGFHDDLEYAMTTGDKLYSAAAISPTDVSIISLPALYKSITVAMPKNPTMAAAPAGFIPEIHTKGNMK